MVRAPKLLPWDKVLVRNVGLKGKHKISDRWNKKVFCCSISSRFRYSCFQVKKEYGRSNIRTLHRNLLLPIMGVPLRESHHSMTPADAEGQETIDSIEQSTSQASAKPRECPGMDDIDIV